jgi:geranylgeranyl diphosphate synthase type II
MKTAALLRTSVVAGGIAGGATDEHLEQLAIYGERIGLAFQIVDDILDVTASTEKLGKPQGSDARHGKATFASVLGVESSRERVTQLIDEAKEAIIVFGNDARVLHELADFIEERTH